jgi:hypothetical protein
MAFRVLLIGHPCRLGYLVRLALRLTPELTKAEFLRPELPLHHRVDLNAIEKVVKCRIRSPDWQSVIFPTE